MNVNVISTSVSRIIGLQGLILLLPALIVFVSGEPWTNSFSFLIPALLCFILYLLLNREGQTKFEELYTIEGFMIVALTWISLSLIGALPFLISGNLTSIVDALFESTSGFTGTGASVVPDVSVFEPSVLFWRSLTQWLGGMGILVFAVAIFPQSNASAFHVIQAESTGTKLGKLQTSVSQTTKRLISLYVTLTIITILALIIGGVSPFYSMLLSFGTAGTAGMNPFLSPLLPYDSIYVQAVLVISMLAFGTNFNLYIHLLNKQVKEVWRDEELRWYSSLLAVAVILITLTLVLNGGNFVGSLKDSLFQVASLSTTTSYLTADFDVWPIFAKTILLILMFIGGMSGSTAGGLKVSRVVLLIKETFSEIKRISYPHRIVTTRYNNEVVKDRQMRPIINYFLVYILIFILSILIFSLETEGFASAFSAAAAALNNIGIGFNEVGPLGTYAHFNAPTKLFASFLFIVGRLEIYPILVLFTPNVWRRRIL